MKQSNLIYTNRNNIENLVKKLCFRQICKAYIICSGLFKTEYTKCNIVYFLNNRLCD